MAYAMTKRGSLDNCVTYEFICDTIEDMNAIEDRYRTIGSIAIVLQGDNGLEVYISGSDKQWNSLSSIGGSSSAGLAIHICGQNEVSEGLPNVSEPDETTIYLVPTEDEESGNLYDEYIYIDDDWEKFGGGNTIDLTGYYQKPVNGIPASDLANGVIPDVSIYAPIASPVFTGSISLGRTANTTVGTDSAALGSDVTASGYGSHAEGGATTASSTYAHAEGNNTTASNNQSHAEGYRTTASGDASHAEGNSTVASNSSSHAEGSTTTARGSSSHAEGFGSTSATKTIGNTTYTGTGAHGSYSHSEGYQTWAIGDEAHAEGLFTIASNSASHAEGESTQALAQYTHAEGGHTIANRSYSHAEGLGNNNLTRTINGASYSGTGAHGEYSHVEGKETWTMGACAHAEGESTVASGTGSHAEGSSTIANGSYSHAEGQGSISTIKTFNNQTYTGAGAYGIGSHVEGINTWAIGVYSHAEGSGTVALGTQAHVEGSQSIASGPAAHAEGMGGTFTLNSVQYTSEAKGVADHVEGYQCLTTNGQPGNHAEGYQTRATGGASHAEGSGTIASGVQTHAEGCTTTASGAYSHSEGYYTVVSGNYSHVEGNYATCSGYNAHAEGQHTIASGAYAHVEGRYAIASGDHSHVGGKFNIDDALSNWIANTEYKIGDRITFGTNQNYICKTAHTSGSTFSSQYWSSIDGEKNYAVIIGNGTAENSRSNAYALDWDGNEHLMGDIYVGCNADSTGGVKLPRIPEPPTTDGTYTLQVAVSNGIPTYSWV